MKKTYILLGFICALTSCKSAIDKSITEPLSNKEMVKICKDHSDLKLEKTLAYIGSEESYARQLGKELYLRYADVTYRDIVEFRERVTDEETIEEIRKKYDQYTSHLCDSAWKKINDIRESIKRDTSFNKYAKIYYTQGEKTDRYLCPPRIRKTIDANIDLYDDNITHLGGIVSKASKEGVNNPIIEFHIYDAKVDRYGCNFLKHPVYNEDTLDFISGEYDYAFNVLWVEKDGETLYTSKEYWDLLKSHSEPRLFGYSFCDSYFERDKAIDDEQLFKITNIDIMSKEEFADSLFRKQLDEKTIRAGEFYTQIMR
ncbi:MAG: hypothetical protein IKN77_11210 [Paludibacteraceae bacterium]|nr:hypothetical protein [Paludibacteraceae bacterium]